MWFPAILLVTVAYFGIKQPANAKEIFGPFLQMGAFLPGGSDQTTVLARTIYGEARNEGYAGMQAVANVIINRVKAKKIMWGLTIQAVCMKRAQFSTWNPYYGLNTNNASMVANYNTMINATSADPKFAMALEIARKAIAGTLPDITGGATYYLTRQQYDIHQNAGRKTGSSWSFGERPITTAGSHYFFTTDQIG